jgi:biopolymer transport protein ExbD
MAFNFSSGRKPLAVFGMAGLADIVLLLLIFFLLTSTFIPQLGIQVNLPQADAAAPNEPNHVSVAITKEGRYYVDGTQVARENLLEAITEAQGTKTALVIRADEEATINQFTAVAAIAKAVGLRVLMATEREDLRPR